MHKIIRVFPTRTAATPDDLLAFSCHGLGKKHVCAVPSMFTPKVDEVHISVAFSWDCDHAEWLAEQWKHIAPVKIGGPGYSNDPGSSFVPGMYMKNGFVITSRGCPNRCWFCSVWKREPSLIELPITDGHIVQDDNLLACSNQHIEAVFQMLQRQPQRAELRGLEARLLREWHIELFLKTRIDSLWFAYDEPDDLEPLVNAGKLLKAAGFNCNKMYCYVLVGHPKDTMGDAEKRLYRAWKEGFMPFAMLWRNKKGYRDPEWVTFAWPWCRPAAARSICMKNDMEAEKQKLTTVCRNSLKV